MRAIVYVRVSSADQVRGFSLDVQEQVCRDFCDRQKWTVGLVSREEGESAKTTDRRELQKLLARLRKPGHGFTHLVVYDLTRFTRDTSDYLTLKGFLAGVGVALVSVTQPMEDSPTGKFLGTVLAATGQLDNDMRREKVLAGMREAVKRGIWPWVAPLGYLSARLPDKRATLIHDPERAPLIRNVFDRIASGMATQEEARAELERAGLRLPRESFRRLVHNPIYYGRIVVPSWGLEAAGAFRPLVSEETWRRAQEALSGKPFGWKRSDLRPEFPLRWWTRCAACGRPLTGSFSKGKRGLFPYYRCPGACQNVSRDRLHAAFGLLLDGLATPPGVWRLWEAILGDVYEQKAKAQRAVTEAARRRLRDLETKEERVISALLDGNLDAPTVKRMRARIAEERSGVGAPPPLPDFEHAIRIGRRLAENPRATWDALAPEVRPGFLRAAFPERLDHAPDSGFRTPSKSLYIGNLTQPSGAQREEWWTQRDGLRTADEGVYLLAGWERLSPLLPEDRCQIDQM